MTKENNSPDVYKVSEDFRLFTIIKKSKDINEINDATVELWNKYKLLIIKDKNALIEIARDNNVSMESEFFDDYETDCYTYFQKAIDSVNIDREELIKMKKTWTFWLQFHRYLQCYNRTIITAAKNKHKYEVSEWARGRDNEQISRFDLDATNSFMNPYDELEKSEISRIQRMAIDDALKQFSPTQRSIWDMRLDGKKNKEITSSLKISNQDVTENLRSMKMLINSLIAKYSSKSNITQVPQRKKRILFDEMIYDKKGDSKSPKLEKGDDYKTVRHEYVMYS